MATAEAIRGKKLPQGSPRIKSGNCVGGFAARNTGKIENCYSVLSLSDNNRLSAGFTAENNGSLTDCFAFCSVKGLKGGFSAKNTGSENSCYFFIPGRANDASLNKLSDADLGRYIQRLRHSEDYTALGFDMDGRWQMGAPGAPIVFNSDNWHYKPDAGGREVISIGTADELRAFAHKVNSGDENSRRAFVRITDDIDLEGKEWTPIGADRSTAFVGVFDGGEHIISNFSVRRRRADNAGFFGVMRGSVYDLTVDCAIGESAHGGGLAACNEGTIDCCAAIVDIKNSLGTVGGLVGVNRGEIFRSYSAGRLSTIPILPVFIGASALLLLAAIIIAFSQTDAAHNLFAPVPYDPDAVIDPEETIQPNTDGNFVSFQFEQEIGVNLSSGLCSFNFKNPGESNHNIVVQLQFADSQAVNIMGSTGRTDEEQARIEAIPGYDADTYRTVIAESGAIRPGYKLDNLRLVSQPNGATVPPGEYNAIVYLIFYDIGTNNRAMLESQLPVVISVHY